MFKLRDDVTNDTVGCIVTYFLSLMTDWDFIDLENNLLNWQTSCVWFMTQFKQDQYMICLVRETGRGVASALLKFEDRLLMLCYKAVPTTDVYT